MLLWFSWYIMQSHTSSVMLPLECFWSPNIALPSPGGPGQGWSDLGWCLHGSAAAQPHSCLDCFSAASGFCSWGPLISGGLGSLVTCTGGAATTAAIFKRFGLRLRDVLPWGSLGHSRTGLKKWTRPHPQPEWGSWEAGALVLIHCSLPVPFPLRPDHSLHTGYVWISCSIALTHVWPWIPTFCCWKDVSICVFCGHTVLCCSGFLAAQPTYRITGWSSAQLESSGLCKPAEATKS